MRLLDSLLAIIEIFANISAFGEGAEDFKHLLIDQNALENSLILLKSIKLATDIMIEHKIYEPEEKFATYSSKTKSRHPFSGFLSKIVKLIANLTHNTNAAVEQTFRRNKDYLGLVLMHTKMDEDNPTLREWCLLVIRNLCMGSDKIRAELEKLKLVDLGEEGKRTLDKLGMQQVYEKELKKLQKREGNKSHFSKI